MSIETPVTTEEFDLALPAGRLHAKRYGSAGAPLERLVRADGPETLCEGTHGRRVAGVAVDRPLQLLVDPVDVSSPRNLRLRHAAKF